MSDAWEELGPKPQQTAESDHRLAWISRWVLKGMHHPDFDRQLLEAAVKANLLSRTEASAHAKKHLSWLDAWELYHGRRYVTPSRATVRPDWRSIGYRWLTAAEQDLADEAKSKLRFEMWEPRRMP